jgi:DHA1 family multidrug resistance protein-like MFS transporter
MGVVVAPWQLLILFILDGALSGTVSAAMTLVAVSTPKDRIGYAMGLLQTAIFSGFSLGPLLGGLLADRIGYRSVFGVGSLLLVSAAMLALVLTRETFSRPTPGPSDGRRRSQLTQVRVILIAGAMPAALGVLFALRLATGAVTPVLPLFVERIAPAGTQVASLTGLTFGVSGVGSAIAALTLGRGADRFGHRLVLITAGLLVAALFVPLALVHAPWQLVTCYGLLGFATGGITPSAMAIVTNLTPAERRGAILGVATGVASLGGFFGPFEGSLLAATANFRLVFLVSSGVMLAFTLWLGAATRPSHSIALEGVDVEQPLPTPRN